MINKYLIGFAVVILLMIIGIILIFSGGSEKPPAVERLKPLPEYADSFAESSMTIRGQINGEDQHREIRITVGQFQRRLDIIAGYSGTVIQTQSFPNTVPAYREFLAAINGAGFLAERKASSTAADPLGKCPLGNLYEFELNDSGDSLSYLWTSSCGNNSGTLRIRPQTLQTLFQNQITDYNKLTSGTRL